MNSGVPQSVYQLDTTGMTKVSGSPHLLLPGQSWTLPGGKGSITFVGVKQWASLAITYDPGQVPALVCGILALAGLLISFFVRRRRVFVRAVPAASGAGSVVTVGGLTRSDASGGFEEEFAELATEIARRARASQSLSQAARPGGTSALKHSGSVRLVSVNLGFAQASSDFLIAALLIYSLAVLAFAGDYAFGRPRRTRPRRPRSAAAVPPQLATVGAGARGRVPRRRRMTAGARRPPVVAGPAPAPGCGAVQGPSGKRGHGSAPPWRSASSARSRTWWR